MTDSPIHALSAAGLASRIREGTLSPVTVVDALLSRIDEETGLRVATAFERANPLDDDYPFA